MAEATPTPSAAAADLPAGAGPSANWRAMGLPLGVSIAVHGLIALLVAGVAWRMTMPTTEGPPPTEAFIAVATPMTSATLTDRAPAPAAPVAPSEPAPSGPSAAQLPSTAATHIILTPAPTPTAALTAPPVQTITAALAEPPASIVSFAGLSAKRASSVAYVIDGSALVVGVLPRVMAEVRASTAALLPVQQFSVVVFRDSSPEAEAPGNSAAAPAWPAAHGALETTSDVFTPRLVDASPRNLGRLSDWLTRIEPRGRSNPLDGLRAALALKPRPQVIFLLSRSIARSHGGQWGDGKESILAELERLNPIDPATNQRKTVIKALQFVEPDPTGMMQAIAERHGGGGTTPDYRVLRVEDLPPR